MKLFKSILSFVLALAILPLGAQASAFDNAQAPYYYSSQLDFISSVDIIDGIDNTDYSRIVTRAEFAHMAVNMLNISTAAPISTAFSDVTSDTAYADSISTALSYGLLKGTSEGTFSPEKPITYAAALKILVAALGYEEYAFVSGGYPAGYIMQADKIGLLDGINTYSFNDILDFATVVAMISNALTCDLRKIASVSGDYVETTVTKGNNCLTQYFNLSHTSGIVVTAGYHSMLHGYNEEDSFIQIGELTLKCSITDAHKYLGYSVDAWYNPDTRQAIALRTDSVNTSVVIKADMVDSYSDFKLIVYTDDDYNTKTYSFDKGYSFVLNGRLVSPTAGDFSFKHGTLTLIDNNGDKRYDVVIANHKTYMVVRGINTSTKTVYDRNRNDIKLVLDSEDGYHYSMLLGGTSVDHSALEPDMVLEVAQSADGYVADVVISTQSKKGTITAIGQDFICIDDAEYETNEYFNTFCKSELGQSGTFLLDPDGRVTFISDRYINSVQYGYLLDMASQKNALSSDNVMIKLFTDSGDVVTLNLAEKVTFEGKQRYNNDSAIYNALMNEVISDGQKLAIPNYQLIRFGTDGNGLVNLIDISSDVAANSDLAAKYAENISDNSLTRYVKAEEKRDTGVGAGNAYWRKAGNAFAPYFTLGNTVIIQVPIAIINNRIAGTQLTGKFDESAFSIIGTGNLPNYGWRYVDAYDYDDSMTPKIVVMYYSTATPGQIAKVIPDESDPIHLVERVINCINDDGEETKRIYSYADGGFQINDIAPEVLATLVKDNLIPNPGEAVRLAISPKGINGIARDVICDSSGNFNVQYGVDGVGSTPIDTHTYIAGKVFSSVDNNLVVKTDAINYPTSAIYPTPIDGFCSLRITSDTVVAIFNKASGLVEHGDVSDISDIRSVGETDASYVCVGLGAYEPEFIIIYR